MKRIVCSVLVATMILSIILPILPDGLFKANAAGYFEDPDNGGRTLFTWSSKLKDVNLKISNGSLLDEYGFDDSDSNQRINIGTFSEGSDAKFKSEVERIMNSVPLDYDDSTPLTFDFDYLRDKMTSSNSDLNRAKYDYQESSFNNAWGDISNDTLLLDGMCGAIEYDRGAWEFSYSAGGSQAYIVTVTASGYSKENNMYYYMTALFIDAQSAIGTDWDTVNITLVSSQYLLDQSFRLYNDTFATDLEASGYLSVNYEFKDISREVQLTDDEIATIHNDIANGTFTELPVYNFLDSISSKSDGEHEYKFGTEARMDLFADYTDGQKDDEDDDKWEGYRLYVQPYNEFRLFSDMPGDNDDGDYTFTITDAYVDFGDSSQLFDLSPGYKESPQLTSIALQVAKIIEAMCSSDLENDVWDDKAKTYAQTLAGRYPDSITSEVENFMLKMIERRKTWMLDGAGQDMSLDDINCDDLDGSTNQYLILNRILKYNINQTFNKKIINERSEITCNNGSKRIKLTFNEDARGSCDYTLNDLWKDCTGPQQVMLAYTFHELHNLRFNNSFGNDWNYISYNDGISKMGIYKSDVATQLSGNGQLSIESIKEVISNREDSLTNTRSVYNVARNANSLGQYIIGISLYSEGNTEQDNANLYSIYDATLHSLLHLNYEYSDTNSDWYPEYLISDLGIMSESVGSDTNTLTMLLADNPEDLDIFIMYLYNLTYAFEVSAFSEGAQNSNYTPESIRAILNGDKSQDIENYFTWVNSSNSFTAWGSNASAASSVNLTGSNFSIGMFRSIIELHDFCEFMEIIDNECNLTVDWTPAIQEYLKLYHEYESIFNALRNNPYIYAAAPQGESTAEEPLGNFFNIEHGALTDNWIKGFALSSQYVPMETNLYDANSISMIEDSDWISDFYYKYAFYRKALYINTDNSALVNAFISNTESTTRPATLRDLLNYDRDIILTIDDNFYNADDIETVISNLDYTSVRQNTDATATKDGSQLAKVEDWIMGAFSLAPRQILKTGQEVYYSDVLAQNCTKLGQKDENELASLRKVFDVYLLSHDDILGDNSVLDDYEYSVRQSYGVVSAVYRSESLYNETLRAIVSDNAIFKSSKAICYTPGTSSSDWRAIYNYYMLANLEDQMKNDAASTLDLDAPIFCDIFGNIVTESGLVIIPAASNATLCGKDWTPYTIGWSEYYNNGNRIPGGEFTDEVYTWLLGYDYSSVVEYITYDENNNWKPIMPDNTALTSQERVKSNGGGYFEIDRSGDLILRTTSLNSNNLSAIIQWDTLNKNSTIIKQLFFNDAYFNKGNNMYHNRVVNLIVETLRGAPIEHIDYEYEGLDGNMDISKYGVYMAYKLEELTNSLISGTNGNSMGGNAVVTMPNLAFMSGIEYIVLYVFKIVFAVAVAGLAISLYMDAVVNSLGIRSVGKFIMTVGMVIVAITLVPNLITWSYYKANKDVLSSEVGYIMMLNYCKEFDGSEIGITSVETPETETELFIKVDDISVDWWTVIDDVLFKNTYKTVSELYDDQMDNNAMQGLPGVQTKGDGLYVDVQDVFNSTNMNYLPATGVLKNTVYGSGVKKNSVDTVTSFTMPYYVILEQLIANINEYNIQRDISAYSYSVGANGSILTYDIIGPYLKSDEFLVDGYDILGMDKILNLPNQRLCYNFAFIQDELDYMSLSQWYPTDVYTVEMRTAAVDRLYDKARTYVAENADLIGKVPDEVFLKVMAMQLAIEFNKEFNAPYGKSIEIMNIDTRDLARFMVADRATMYKYFSYGYARYTYEEAGGIGVIFAGLFIAVLWLTSFIKPLFMIIILGLLIFNTIFRKLLFRKESKSIEGYLIGCACLCLTNYAYAGMLKVSLNIANTGLGSITALACALIVQIAYIACLVGILMIEVKDWKNSGYGEFANIGANVFAGISHAKQLVVEKMISKGNQSYADTAASRRYASENVDMGTLDDMLDRDAEREERGTYSPT